MKPCEQVLSVSVNENWKHIELQDVLDCLKHLYGANRILLIIIILRRYRPCFILLSNVGFCKHHSQDFHIFGYQLRQNIPRLLNTHVISANRHTEAPNTHKHASTSQPHLQNAHPPINSFGRL